MADIRNYTINFVFGRPAALTFAALTLACDEVDLRIGRADDVPSRKVG
ncbi:MAG: hypothetical protein FD187_181 [bacterium]|nr:MAG: hypothetical protein FD142_1398 [bacterium]KAF0150749.1 MAG: hypothetical protein FD187_181 [bacterium]KAF0164394.1 MAG: hypothetical protein FD158_3062 [bacterium]TXT17043.1 MAG: hypothetical protein FD132_2594 [bacterium]